MYLEVGVLERKEDFRGVLDTEWINVIFYINNYYGNNNKKNKFWNYKSLDFKLMVFLR